MLQQQIADIESEISELKQELEQVQAKIAELGGETPSTEGAVESSQDDATGAEDQEPSELEQLKNRETEILQEIVAKQMKLTALNKQLNDIISNESMKNYGEE